MTELVTFGETGLSLSPPAGRRLAAAPQFDVHVSGAASNVAVAAAELGAEAAWLSALPDSPLGRRVVGGLKRHGVRTGVSWTDPDAARVSTRYHEHGGAPRGSATRFHRDGSAVATASPADLPAGAIRDADAFYASGVPAALSTTARDTTAALLEAAREAGTTTVFAPNYRRAGEQARARETGEALFPAVDVLVVEQSAAERALGAAENAVAFAHRLARAHDFESVVVARGEDGALCLCGDEVHECPAFETETVDRTGATDAFVGGYLAARLDGESVPDALRRGAAADALVRTVTGAALTTTPAEVEAVIERRSEGENPR